MSLSIAHVTVDCTDAAALATFYSRVLDAPVDDGASEFFATIGMGRPDVLSPTLMFLKVPEPKAAKNRVHLDLHTDDLVGDVARVVALGATHLSDHDEYGTTWTCLQDPEGNEFDIGTELV